MRRASLLLADDHTILIEGLVGLLKDRFEVVGTVSDGQGLVDAALRLRPDVIVADLAMPGMSGLDAMAQVKKHGLESRFVVLTMHHEAVIARGRDTSRRSRRCPVHIRPKAYVLCVRSVSTSVIPLL